MILLNLGCGPNKIDGFINLDYNESLQPDIVHNLEEVPLPFETISVDGGLASHVFEHIHNFPALLQDVWRITKPGGVWEVRVPHYLSPDAWGDITHVRAFSPQSFTMGLAGWNVIELNCREYTKLLSNDPVTHIEVRMIRFPRYIVYTSDEFMKQMELKGMTSAPDTVRVSDGEKELEQIIELMQSGELQVEGAE